MSIQVEHELHQRRFGRNLGVGLSLAAFIIIVFGLTIAKLSSGPVANTSGEIILK
ncbi:MAG: hypothetical protein OXC62_14130 [Aestuariivita sp.]|nr:hypothetical protein [Aestuariivita sp.]